MPQGPFASSVGVGRAEPEWANLNKVAGVVGADRIEAGGETSEAPLELPAEVLSGDLSSAPAKVDLLIVGAGLSGAVLAERCSKELGMTSLILDVRDHIGGNVYDYIDSHGIRASKYGAHLFHTKFERVWDYVTQFSKWLPFDHRVKGMVPDKDGVKRLVPIPPTQETVNTLFGALPPAAPARASSTRKRNLPPARMDLQATRPRPSQPLAPSRPPPPPSTPPAPARSFHPRACPAGANVTSDEEMQQWYDKERVPPPSGAPSNGEEAALSRVGKSLYEPIFKHYTKKQWDKCAPPSSATPPRRFQRLGRRPTPPRGLALVVCPSSDA